MTFNFTKLNRLVLEQNEWDLPGSSERKIPLEVVILISHVLGLGFSSCTSFLLKHRYNQVVLRRRKLRIFAQLTVQCPSMIAQESSANFVGVTVHIRWFFKKPNFQMWANLGHQIVLRHKYCESPAQMRLVFKYVKYLPGREKGIWIRSSGSIRWLFNLHI